MEIERPDRNDAIGLFHGSRSRILGTVFHILELYKKHRTHKKQEQKA